MDFTLTICKSGLHCRVCRDPSTSGRAWRRSLLAAHHREWTSADPDFPCTSRNLPWGWAGVIPASTCVPAMVHATWCERFGLPTSETSCSVCAGARKPQETDPDLAPWFAQSMRDLGRLYGAATCPHRRDTGKTEERICCGGKVKQIPIYLCALTGAAANCQRCRDKMMETSIIAKKS